MHAMDLKWFSKNQVTVLYSVSFAVLLSIFGVLWAFVLLITIELIENNFEFNLNIDHSEEDFQDRVHHNQHQRRYSVSQDFDSFFEPDRMYTMDEKQKKNSNNGRGEARPSLTSLIKHNSGVAYNKENYRNQDRNQPLLAVVKNNLHLRRRSELSQMSKSPLYKNLIPNSSGRKSSFGGYKSPSVMMSPKIHPTSGWYQNSPSQEFSSPSLSPSVSFNRSNIYSNTSLNNTSNTTLGLEVHGSYFLNRSLLHSNLAEEEQFSLVNSNFKSPQQIPKVFTPISSSVLRVKSQPSIDETSTEAVVSILKEKSKRKRAMEEADLEEQQRSDECSRKKIKFDPLDDTIDNLFPPVQKRKRINSKNVIITKKRLASVGTQYENVKTDNDDRNVSSQSKKSRYGLTDEQTDEMMADERKENRLIPTKSEASKTSLEAKELQHAVNNVKESLVKYKNENKVSFSSDTSLLKNNESQQVHQEQLFQTPIKQNESFKELKSSSALKSLKSPYKKIFHSFPSNLAVGSAEKRRKHPVYFTAKIDVDDIQSKREEYGDRGASLKAFRLDQEEAKQRVESIFNDEVDFKVTSTLHSGLLSSSLVTSSLATTTAAPSLLSTLKMPIAGVGGPTTSISFNITPAAASSVQSTNLTVTTAAVSLPALITTSSASVDNQKVTPKKVSFALPTTSTANAPSLFPTAAPQSAVSAAPVFSMNKPTASITATASSATMGFTFGTAAINVSNPPTAISTTTAAPSYPGGISLSFNNTSSATKLPSFGEATAAKLVMPTTSLSTAAASAAPQFSFGSKAPVTTTVAAPNFFGAAPSANVTSITAPTLNMFGSATGSAAFGVAPTTTTTALPAPVSSAANMFGAAPKTSQPAPSFNFGQAASKPPVPSVFGVPSVAAQPTTQPPSANLFGAPKATPGGFSFSSAAASATSASSIPGSSSIPGGFNFGKSTATTTPSVQNLFGAPSAQTAAVPTQNVFASSATTNPPASNLFGGSATTNLFGATSTSTTTAAASVFGKPAVTASGFNFGSAASTASTGFSFGATSAAQPATASIAPAFGQPAVAGSLFGQSIGGASSSSVFAPAPKSTATGFGQALTNTSSVFGQPANTGSAFGQTSTTASIFGKPAAGTSTNVFGAPSTGSSSVFGGGPSTAPTPFGGAPSTAPTPFGNTNVADKKTSSVFGGVSSNTATGAANPFGQPSSNAGGGGFNFNASAAAPKPQASFNFGSSGGIGANSFGAPSTPAKPSFNFGGASQQGTPSFGAPSTPSFATPQPNMFGTPQAAAPFGAPSPAAGGFSMGTGGAPPARSTQRARRRLKK